MPWWSWIVIWIALIALSLLFFGVLGLRLYRQAMITLRELSEAADRFSRVPSAVAPGSGPPAAGADADADAAPRPVPGGRRFCLACPDAS